MGTSAFVATLLSNKVIRTIWRITRAAETLIPSKSLQKKTLDQRATQPILTYVMMQRRRRLRSSPRCRPLIWKPLSKRRQKQYTEANEKKDKDVAAMKDSGLGLMKAVAAHSK